MTFLATNRPGAPLYLLDTDTASYIIKRHTTGIERRLQEVRPDAVAVSAITRAELLYGLQKVASKNGLHALVHAFLSAVRTLPWDEEAADQYAGIRHSLTVSGQPIGSLDMMIAAHAVATGTILVTNNTRHFEHVRPKLRLENWVDP